MSDVSDRWSCPRCDLTVVRDIEPLHNWLMFIRAYQATHGPACSKKASTK